jgi:hypothetical protein
VTFIVETLIGAATLRRAGSPALIAVVGGCRGEPGCRDKENEYGGQNTMRYSVSSLHSFSFLSVGNIALELAALIKTTLNVSIVLVVERCITVFVSILGGYPARPVPFRASGEVRRAFIVVVDTLLLAPAEAVVPGLLCLLYAFQVRRTTIIRRSGH